MNTDPTVETLLSAVEVAKATGIEVYDLSALHPDYFGVPGHWRMNKHGVVVYTVAGVEGLVEVLEARGLDAKAHSLRVALKQAVETPSRKLAEPVSKPAWFREGSMA